MTGATSSGAPRPARSHDPHWILNLRAAGRTAVQVMDRRFGATFEEYVGAKRDAVWNDLITVRVPAVRRYAARAGRTIPVGILRPTTKPPAPLDE